MWARHAIIVTLKIFLAAHYWWARTGIQLTVYNYAKLYLLPSLTKIRIEYQFPPRLKDLDRVNRAPCLTP